MTPHLHTGVISALFAGVSAIVVIKLTKIVAAKMVENPNTEPAGRWLGGLVN